MKEPFVPGPYDEFRGVFEFDCSELLPPERKSEFHLGRFVTTHQAPDDLEVDDRPAHEKLDPPEPDR